jgi:hypothetical protein
VTDEPRSRSLIPSRSPVTLEARAEPGREVLRAPASGQPCVHWRLRVVEHLTARTELVHEIASPEAFDLAWGGDGVDGGAAGPAGAGRGPVRIRLDPESARIEATPSLYRPGTPAAQAVARVFGFSGAISVEEVVIRAGDALTADGVLEDLAAGSGPFRAPEHALELFDATVRLPSRSLGPALLPWALGTAAALLGGMGMATWASWRYHVAHLQLGPGSRRLVDRLVGSPARMSPPELPHPSFP